MTLKSTSFQFIYSQSLSHQNNNNYISVWKRIDYDWFHGANRRTHWSNRRVKRGVDGSRCNAQDIDMPA